MIVGHKQIFLLKILLLVLSSTIRYTTMTVFNKPTKLNEVQMHFLQFLSQRQVSNQELEDIQRMIAQYYFDKAEIELEKIIQEKGITETSMEDLKNQHLRTPYQ